VDRVYDVALHPGYVVVDGEEHDEDEEGEPDPLADFERPLAEGLFLYGFDCEVENVPAVEHRYREEVYHREVDADEAGELKELRYAGLRCRARDLGDEYRPREALARRA